MHFLGYSVEFLVNNTPLNEFTEPVDSSSPTPNTSSYVVVNGEKRECPTNYFASTPTSQAEFTIRIGAPPKGEQPTIIKANVDGQADGAARNIFMEPLVIQTIRGLGNDKKFKMKFGKTSWGDEGQEASMDKWGGEVGAVTIAFWEAKWALQSTGKASRAKELETVKVAEGKKTKDLEVTVQLEELPCKPKAVSRTSDTKKWRWIRASNAPVAVLQLNYRSPFVLARRGHDALLPELESVNLAKTSELPMRTSTKRERNPSALDDEDGANQENGGEGSSRRVGWWNERNAKKPRSIKKKPRSIRKKSVKRETSANVMVKSSWEEPIVIGSSDEETPKPEAVELD